mmetsp:Transcript_10480/g.29958  ORF Transcript_10480/g.29958 Transcript_10480/m.29958 type:complete len:131 (-) Transcript_10480:2094-2486(-)
MVTGEAAGCTRFFFLESLPWFTESTSMMMMMMMIATVAERTGTLKSALDLLHAWHGQPKGRRPLRLIDTSVVVAVIIVGVERVIEIKHGISKFLESISDELDPGMLRRVVVGHCDEDPGHCTRAGHLGTA